MMGVNSFIEELDEPEEQYPILKKSKSTGIVVLFKSKRIGTVVYSVDASYTIGTYEEHWSEDGFVKHNGSITLENA
jgi:hypothetical protein